MKHWTEAMRTTWRSMKDWPSHEIIEFGRHCLMEFGQSNRGSLEMFDTRAAKRDPATGGKYVEMGTGEVEFVVSWHDRKNNQMSYFLWARDPETAVQEAKRRWSILDEGYATVRRVYR